VAAEAHNPETMPRPNLVLVVEDNPVNRRMIGKLLSVIGIASEAVATGREALDRFDPAVHGLILTDLRMPGMDGLELTRQIRHREADAQQAPVPIIALTADAQAATQDRCRAAGMNGYLTKPVEVTALRPLLEQWLDL
jgi:CheY-like chemotaxis protein